MIQRSYIPLILIIAISLASCTSARWTVKDQKAIDQSEYEVLREYQFLAKSGEITPENPVLTLDILSKTTYQYRQRVLVQRNIQEYRPRPGFVALGLTGAALAFYAANSTAITGNTRSTKSVTLNTAGALLALSGFFNMKPIGDPKPTGEERLLRSTGNIIQTDTVNVQESINVTGNIEVSYDGSLIFTEENRSTEENQLQISLANKLNNLQITGPNPGQITINIDFRDSTYAYKYPVETILQPYARVTSQLTELRNSPEESSENILADLVLGSQVQIQSFNNEEWYQVLYGISESFVRREDTELIWRSSDFAQENQVVTVPRVPFGNIDVESNIPILRGPSPNSVALIVTNQNYTDKLPERNYAHRDGRLIQTYLEDALGFQEENVYQLADINNPSQLYRTLSEMRFATNDSTELFVYLSGYGSVQNVTTDPELTFLNINSDHETNSEPIILSQLFEQISSIPSATTLFLGDIDFSRAFTGQDLTANERQRILESHASELTFGDPNSTLLMGAHLNQPSQLYMSSNGEDKKHHIFPYFFAKALQQRNTSLSTIYQYLERNISYHARRLHDQPQDPILLGNSSLDLVRQ